MFREGGGCVYIEIASGNRREARLRFTKLGGEYWGKIYDSDHVEKRALPTEEEIARLLKDLPEEKVIVALGSNPATMENELVAMVIRSLTDWQVFIGELRPKVVTITDADGFRLCVAKSDIVLRQ